MHAPQLAPIARASLAISLAVALLLAAGCRAKPRSTPAAAAPAWKMSLAMAPTPPTSSGPTTFTLRVNDASGQPLAGASAALDLVMVTMDMGANHVALTQPSPGVFTGQGTFMMSGPWKVNATVTASGRTQTQTFPVQVH